MSAIKSGRAEREFDRTLRSAARQCHLEHAKGLVRVVQNMSGVPARRGERLAMFVGLSQSIYDMQGVRNIWAAAAMHRPMMEAGLKFAGNCEVGLTEVEKGDHTFREGSGAAHMAVFWRTKKSGEDGIASARVKWSRGEKRSSIRKAMQNAVHGNPEWIHVQASNIMLSWWHTGVRMEIPWERVRDGEEIRKELKRVEARWEMERRLN